MTTIRPPHSFLFSRLSRPSSLIIVRCSSLLSILKTLFQTHSNSSVPFACWDPQAWMEYCRWKLQHAS